MKDIADAGRRIDAAGAVTIIFGVLTAMLAAAYVVVHAIGRASSDPVPVAELSLTLLAGVGFVLLGWGVLRRSRLCAGIAGAFAAALVMLQLVGRFQGREISLFFIILPAFVLAGNWVAWREITRQAESADTPAADQP